MGCLLQVSTFPSLLEGKVLRLTVNARDPITASVLDVGAPASCSRHKRSRGIGTELLENPVLLSLKVGTLKTEWFLSLPSPEHRK